MSSISESRGSLPITFVGYSPQHYRDPKWGASREAMERLGPNANPQAFKRTWNAVHRELVNGQSRQFARDKRVERRLGINIKDGHY